LVSLSLFNYQDDARSNKHKIYFVFAPKVQFHYAGISRELRFSRKFSTYNNSSKTTALKYTINLVSNYCVRNQDILNFTCRVGQIRLKNYWILIPYVLCGNIIILLILFNYLVNRKFYVQKRTEHKNLRFTDSNWTDFYSF